MKLPLLRATLVAACLTLRLGAQNPANPPESAPIAEPPPVLAPASNRTPEEQKKLEETIRVRLAEHVLKKAGKPATPPATTTTAPAGTATAATAEPAKEDPTMLLPRVEVNQSRITELAIALHEKDLEIAREKKNIKTTALDESLNDTKVAHTLAIFGGSAASDRSRLAEERVSLLEAERDLIEQVYTARTKEERDDLQKQLNELKMMRRELERAPKDTRGDNR